MKIHPLTGQAIRPVGVRKPRPGECGFQPIYPILGGADDPPKDPPPANDPPEDPPSNDPPKTFTQEEVNALMAKEKRQGKSAGSKEVLEQLGVDSLDDAKAVIEAKRKEEEAAQTEQEKRDKALAERERKADEREKEATRRERAATIRVALVQQGATDKDDLADAAALLAGAIKDDDDEDAINEAAEALAKRRPELFKSPADPNRPPAAPIPRGGPRNRNTPDPVPYGQNGKAEAERRFGKKKADA